MFYTACLFRPQHFVHHLSVQNVFQLTGRINTWLKLLVEAYSLGIEPDLCVDVLFLLTLFHFLVCVFECVIVCCTEPFRHGAVGNQGLASVTSPLEEGKLAFTNIFLIGGLADKSAPHKLRKADA